MNEAGLEILKKIHIFIFKICCISQKSVTFKVLLYNIPNGTARFKNVNNCLNKSIYCYLDSSRGQSSNPYLNVVHF
jgi:hypothetical protein